MRWPKKRAESLANRFFSVWLGVVLVLLVFSQTKPVSAQQEPAVSSSKASSKTLFDEAETAEKRFDFATALRLYEQVVVSSDAGVERSIAQARVMFLQRHQEGEFGPLIALEKKKRQTGQAMSRDETKSFYEETKQFADGPVRAEAQLFCAEYARRAGWNDLAEMAANQVSKDDFADRSTRSAALRTLAELYRASGRESQAERLVPSAKREAPALAESLRVERTARLLTQGAFVVWAVLLVSAVAGVVTKRSWRVLQAGNPAVSALSCTLIAGMGGGLVLLYDDTLSAQPFVLLGVGLFVVERALTTLRNTAFERAAWARYLLVLVGLFAVIATAVLSLALTDKSLLTAWLSRQ